MDLVPFCYSTILINKNQKQNMKSNVAIGIQSTVYPDINLGEHDWMLYLKARSIPKIKIIRKINDKLNQILNQKIK